MPCCACVPQRDASGYPILAMDEEWEQREQRVVRSEIKRILLSMTADPVSSMWP